MAAKLSAQVGAVVFGRILVSLINSLKVFLLVRLMTKDDYGALAFALTWQATAIGLGLLAVPDSLLYFLPRNKAGVQRSLVHQSLVLLSVVGVLLAGVICLLSLLPAVPPLGQEQMRTALLCIALSVALDLPASVLASFLLGVERHRASSLLAMGLSLLANLALLLPAWAGASTVQILLAYDVMAAIRLSVAWLAWWRVFRGVQPQTFEGGVRRQMTFAIPLALNGLAGLVNRYFGTYVAGWLLGAAVFADFAIGRQELPFVSTIPYAVAVAVLPRLSALAGGEGGATSKDALSLWHGSIERVALIMLPLFAFVFIEAETLLGVLFESRYRSAALPFRITALMLPLRVTSYGTMLVALGRPKAILRSQLAGMAFNALAIGPLIVWALMGDPGPELRIAWICAASAIATWIIVGIMLQAVGREVGVGFWGAFPWPGYLRRFALVAIAAVPLVGWQLFIDEPESVWLQAALLIVRLLLFAGLYLLLVLRSGFMPPEDRKVLFSWLRLEPLWKKS